MLDRAIVPDEPEKKEKDPVEAIVSALRGALKQLLRVDRQEDEKTSEVEMEVEGEVHTAKKDQPENPSGYDGDG